MIVLGICTSHDAGACILRDGEVLLNMEMERHTRIRHDFGYREDFLLRCLRAAGIGIGDVDLVAINRWGHPSQPCDIPTACDKHHVPFDATIAGRSLPGLSVNHHLAHVAAAYYTSPFDEATVVTLDGGGDEANSSVACCSGDRIVHYESRLIENIASWWCSMPFANYGMKPMHSVDPGSSAGKLMALASYGRHDNAVYERLGHDVYQQTHRAGPFAFNGDEDLSDTHAARSQDVAFALQRRTEILVGEVFARAHATHPHDNLCYAGGVALNCIANTRALPQSGFKRLHVPPFPNDGGLAAGMALYAYHQYAGHRRGGRAFNPYSGPTYDSGDVRRAAEHAARAAGGAVEDVSVDAVADEIARGSIVAMWRGRSEAGPRALGHRSFLARADRTDFRDYLNSAVKMREWFRPYAPIVLAERADEIFEEQGIESPYMTRGATIRPEWRERMGAVCHVDGTTRPQTVAREQEPFIYDLVKAIRVRTGVPAVLNTSLNRKTPIVETPSEAAALFAELPAGIVLVMDEWMVRRP